MDVRTDVRSGPTRAVGRRVLRAQVDDVDVVLARVRAEIAPALDRIVTERDRGSDVWPSVGFDDLHDARIASATRDAVRTRGCLVVRRTFDPARARDWDDELASDIAASMSGGPDGSKPILPIYWSRTQREMRAHPRMRAVQRFLGTCWSPRPASYPPHRAANAYPDRIRRLRRQTPWGGLAPHIDSAAEAWWHTDTHRTIYRHVYAGEVARHDPWCAAGRTGATTAPPGTDLAPPAFRAFLGWTALSAMDSGPGHLHVVPSPIAVAEVLLAALQEDAVDDAPSSGLSLPVDPVRHAGLLAALTSVPPVEPGDSVWWHPDIVHAVPPTTGASHDTSLVYVPFAPACPANDARLIGNDAAFRNGTSPVDFGPTTAAQERRARVRSRPPG